jgi:hypothetical protein
MWKKARFVTKSIRLIYIAELTDIFFHFLVSIYFFRLKPRIQFLWLLVPILFRQFAIAIGQEAAGPETGMAIKDYNDSGLAS